MRSLPNTGCNEGQSQKIKTVINSHHIALPVRNGCAVVLIPCCVSRLDGATSVMITLRQALDDCYITKRNDYDAHGYALFLVALGVAKRELETLLRHALDKLLHYTNK